jgi:S-adenosylmethionine:tRNA ribosyltransferase-isomerase
MKTAISISSCRRGWPRTGEAEDRAAPWVGSELTDHRVSELPDLLHPGDLLVFNDTKVIPAQLEAKRAGVRVEVTLHRRLSGDEWAAFARPAKRLKTGDRLQIATDFTASVTGKAKAR